MGKERACSLAWVGRKTDSSPYTRERPGMSAFVLENGNVYHISSAFRAGSMVSGYVSVARPRVARPKRHERLVASSR